MTSPYSLSAMLAAAREQLVEQAKPAEWPKPLPCANWCALASLESRYAGAMGYCTCSEPCEWEGCPMDVEAFVPPPVPRFREAA